MTDQAWIPEDVDAERPSIARIYDFHLGGNHNLPVDRAAAREVVAVMPELPGILRANRAFLTRCVGYLAEQGVRKFLDLGSGIPTVGNVHEIVQAADPRAAVVYVDNDPVAVEHSRRILLGNDRAEAVDGDLRDPVSILADPVVERLLLADDAPVAVLMSAVLHFVPDDAEAADLVAAYRDAVPAGSWLAVSHGSHKEESAARIGRAAEQYSRTVAPMRLRSLEQVTDLLKGFEIVAPGVVYCEQWRPGPYDDPAPVYPLPQLCALARKP
ncbi:MULTISPECIES: SAM-dependent methyltransferase [Streptacidiphilus]|uniref:SAM-dependent methyltransferase n=1 Tax=Streptacidiphilus cavernicola TaxID=3342716 RepID=A0ABV6UJA1_9ACTN|nr:SAM-dependent methyltransferase [Streptacidiphilus jeojiense]